MLCRRIKWPNWLGQYEASTYIDIHVPESDGAVGDEAGVETVEVVHALHVGDEVGHAQHENDQDGADDHRVEPFVVLELRINPGVHNLKKKPEDKG